MMGTKKLGEAIETGVTAVRKADEGLKLALVLSGATLLIAGLGLVVGLCILASLAARKAAGC